MESSLEEKMSDTEHEYETKSIGLEILVDVEKDETLHAKFKEDLENEPINIVQNMVDLAKEMKETKEKNEKLIKENEALRETIDKMDLEKLKMEKSIQDNKTDNNEDLILKEDFTFDKKNLPDQFTIRLKIVNKVNEIKDKNTPPASSNSTLPNKIVQIPLKSLVDLSRNIENQIVEVENENPALNPYINYPCLSSEEEKVQKQQPFIKAENYFEKDDYPEKDEKKVFEEDKTEINSKLQEIDVEQYQNSIEKETNSSILIVNDGEKEKSTVEPVQSVLGNNKLEKKSKKKKVNNNKNEKKNKTSCSFGLKCFICKAFGQTKFKDDHSNLSPIDIYQSLTDSVQTLDSGHSDPKSYSTLNSIDTNLSIVAAKEEFQKISPEPLPNRSRSYSRSRGKRKAPQPPSNFESQYEINK